MLGALLLSLLALDVFLLGTAISETPPSGTRTGSLVFITTHFARYKTNVLHYTWIGKECQSLIHLFLRN